MPKISALPLQSTPTTADTLPIVSGGVTSRATLATLPISTATQTALDTKAATSDLTTTNTNVTNLTTTVSGLTTTVNNNYTTLSGVDTALDGRLTTAETNISNIHTLTTGTLVSLGSTTTVTFTSIPSWAKQITVYFNGLSLTGTDLVLLQLGNSGGYATSGYLTSYASISTGVSPTVVERTDGWVLQFNLAAGLYTGAITISALNTQRTQWVGQGNFARGGGGVNIVTTAGFGVLTGTGLDSVRLIASGANTFDAGSINIQYS